jgi:hypothetical protein
MARVRVECYSGYKADERPLRFHYGAHSYVVVEITDRWYGPDAVYFRVKADDGNLYILRHSLNPLTDVWTLESFRRLGG